MRITRTRRLAIVGLTVTLVATMLALASATLPSANAAAGKIPDGAVTFTTLAGTFEIGGGSITLPIRHPNSPNECQDGIDNELGAFHGGSQGAPGISPKDGLVDFADSGTTGYAESNGGESTAAGLFTFPTGCTSGADDNELFAHTMGINPTNCSAFGCNTGLTLPDPQSRTNFSISGTVAGNGITIPNAASVSIPNNLLLFGSCLGSLCVNYIAQVQIQANRNEVQEFGIAATGGTYTITFNGQTTAPIPYNALANGGSAGVDTVDEYLGALASVGGAANVDVLGGIGDVNGTAPYRIEFTGTLAGVNQPEITIDTTGLTSSATPGATIDTLREGGTGLTGTTNNDGSGGLSMGLDVTLSLNKTLDSDPLGPSQAVCRTSIFLDLTSETSGTLTGERFDTTQQNMRVVDGTFTMPPFVLGGVHNSFSGLNRLVCDGANDSLGLWDANKAPINSPGDNEVSITASTAAGPWDTAGSDIVADAGPDQVVDECDAITLDGTASWNAAKSDPTVAWNQTGGPTVMGGVGTVQNSDELIAETVAPPGDGTVTMELSYETLIGPHYANTRTDTDTVDIQVNNIAPTIEGPADFSVSTDKTGVGLNATIDDTCTETPDLTVLWQQLSGPSVGTINGATTPNATFDTTGIAGGSVLGFQLQVGDGDDTTTHNVNVTVTDTNSGEISGNVVESSGGSPVAGINSRIYGASGYVKTAITNGSGDYTAAGLTDGNTYSVMFHDPSGTYQRLWYGNSTNVDDRDFVDAPDSAVNGVITTEVGAGTISGQVVDANTGLPLAGVEVVLHDQNGAGFVWNSTTNQVERGFDTTDAGGNWSITGLNPGTYRVRYKLAGYLEKWYDGKSWGWTADNIEVGPNDNIGGIDAALTATADRATLSGTVVQDDGVNEIQEITVTSGGTRSIYSVTFGGETVNVEATQSANDLKTDLETLPGLAGNIAVTGTPGDYEVEFINALAATDVDPLVVAGRDERQTLRVSGVTGAGAGQCGGTSSAGDPPYTCNFTLDFDGQVTAPLALNSTAATVQTALEALSNIAPGDVTVTGGPGNQSGGSPYTIVFGGAYAGMDVPEIIASPSTAESMGNNTQGASVETVAGGSAVSASTTQSSSAPTPLAGVDVRAYSATKGKYVLLDTTDANGEFLIRLPLDTYIVRIVDQVHGNTWEWYDDITADTLGPAHIIADGIDLSAPGASVDIDIELSN